MKYSKRKCGFEARTWLYFDEKYTPDGWVKGRDKTEPVIFMEYTGKKVKMNTNQTLIEKNNFYRATEAINMDDAVGDEVPWDAGYRIRDEMMK